MQIKTSDKYGGLLPAVIGVMIAIAGEAGILLNDLGSGSDLHHRQSAAQITEATLSRAGAVEEPSTLAPG